MSLDTLPADVIVRLPGKKPQLHVSGLNQLLMCGMDYRFRNIENVRESPTFRLLEGTATHRVAEMALRRKALGERAELDEMIVFAREALAEAEQTQGSRLLDDELEGGIEARRSAAIDYVTDLAKLLHDEVVPMIEPQDVDHLEWRWVVELPDRPFDLAGTIDVVEKDGTITDLKTKTGAPPGNVADVSEQLTWYALARLVHAGAIPPKLRLLFLVRTPKQRKVYFREQPTTRCMADLDVAARRIDQAMRLIDMGVFLPAPADSWKCSRKYCDNFARCEFSYKTVRKTEE